MRLYYFTSTRFGLEAIRDQRLKISTVEDLNDPFEWLSITGNKSFRTAMQKTRAKLASHYGVICLSDSWRHPLLWAHYADKHMGLCLGFDVEEHFELKKVEYIKERINWLQDKYLPSEEVLSKILNVCHTKFDAWSYESEYRMLVELQDRDPVSELFFQSFSPYMRLKQVLVGERSNVTRKQLNLVLSSNFKDVETFKVRAAFKNFEIVRNLRQSAWK